MGASDANIPESLWEQVTRSAGVPRTLFQAEEDAFCTPSHQPARRGGGVRSLLAGVPASVSRFS